MNTYLDKILESTKETVAKSKELNSYHSFLPQIKKLQQTRGFVAKILDRDSRGLISVIAESKQASPSQGLIREDYDPTKIAQSYSEYNATCISVLTDTIHFQGSLQHLQDVRSSVDLPLLRKDFIVDEYQIYESRASGADCILLIVAALSDSQLLEYYELASELALDVLVEVHDEEETRRALDIKPQFIGINNRNLKTFEVDLSTTKKLSNLIPDEILCVSESGIKTKQDISQIIDYGITSFLVGESFMRASNPGWELENLFSLKGT